MSGRDLETKIGLRYGYPRNLFSTLNWPKSLKIPSDSRYSSVYRNIFPKKFRGKVIQLLKRPVAR